jgi:hypothetical protein
MVRLACARLAVGKDCAVVPLQNLVHDRAHHAVIHVLLRRLMFGFRFYGLGLGFRSLVVGFGCKQWYTSFCVYVETIERTHSV